jgi:hypothetical protein
MWNVRKECPRAEMEVSMIVCDKGPAGLVP